MSELKTITYTSRASLDLRDDDLSAIHQEARHFNALDGVTGLLVFDGRRFLQIVEGSEEAIDNLVDRLRRDRRHNAFEIRDERKVASRSFPDWSMELVRVNDGYRDARTEVGSILPAQVTAGVRELALRMTDSLAS
jgi:FAD-dependent sensor of blue light